MSAKVNNKKPKGTKQKPTDEPDVPIARELFQDATPKSDKKKDKKRKRGVGESLSESAKDNESLGGNAASSSDDEQGDDADFSESQDSLDLNTIKISKKPLSSNGLKGASGKNQTAGSDETSKTFQVLSSTTFQPVSRLTAKTVSAIEQYVGQESTGGREIHIRTLLNPQADYNLNMEIGADEKVPNDEKDWTKWPKARLLAYLKAKYPYDKQQASMDLDQLVEHVALDLIPENREDFLVTMKTLKDNTAIVFAKEASKFRRKRN